MQLEEGRQFLNLQPDFAAQKGWLEETVVAMGFTIIFSPKYHCELNFIEQIWGWLKSYHRRTCTYNRVELERELPNTLDNLIPIDFVRRASRNNCYGLMSGYRHGLTGALLDYSVKRFRGHRRIPDNIIDKLADDYNNKVALKLEKTQGKFYTNAKGNNPKTDKAAIRAAQAVAVAAVAAGPRSDLMLQFVRIDKNRCISCETIAS